MTSRTFFLRSVLVAAPRFDQFVVTQDRFRPLSSKLCTLSLVVENRATHVSNTKATTPTMKPNSNYFMENMTSAGTQGPKPCQTHTTVATSVTLVSTKMHNYYTT